ncbi:MAG: hypothetical protein KF754_07920 [Planctomycetes bacterium]|nr:hypothetical protein [Planctomycetota bacterium]
MRALALALLVAACLHSVVQSQQEPNPAPRTPEQLREEGKDTLERFAKDRLLFEPQLGLGGDDDGKVDSTRNTLTECKIDVEGCEKLTGYVSVPQGLEKDRKVALMFTFHGNGDPGKGRVNNVSRVSTARDPVITIGLQYQELKEGGQGWFNGPTLAKGDKILEGARWLVDKAIAEHPVDPQRVFVSGFSWGTSWAGGLVSREWQQNPAGFRYRGLFLYSSGSNLGTRDTMPPVPVIATVGEDETAVMGSANVVAAVRQFCNVYRSYGACVQYHEIPKMGHQVNGRCLQITRDVINQLGGPGAQPCAKAAGPKPSALPFAESTDAYVKEVTALCADDHWKEAIARVHAIEKDKAIARDAKKAIKDFDREIEKAAKSESARIEKLLADCIKNEVIPNPYEVSRIRAIAEAYEGAAWLKDRKFRDSLARLEGDFAPVVRERERAEQMRQAWKLESEPGKRAEAKSAYATLAARKTEDGGTSPWPVAAAYRLSWWVDK